MDMKLTNRLALVTGSTAGIGNAIATSLAREGARVLIHYNGSEREARATADECDGAPLFQANLESVAEIRAMFERIGHQPYLPGRTVHRL